MCSKSRNKGLILKEFRPNMDKKTKDVIIILEDMLKIIQGNEMPQKSGGAIHLVGKDGLVNEEAQQKLIKLIKATEGILLKDGSKSKSKGFLSGLLPSSSISTSTSHVQLYVPEQITTESTKLFSSFLKKDLKDIFINCQVVGKNNAKAGIPLLLLCPLSSRIEPSIDHALAEFVWEKPFIVIIVNQETEENLPEIATSKKIPSKESYRNIKFIDMAFNKDDKLYDCSMNNEALLIIKDFVENFD